MAENSVIHDLVKSITAELNDSPTASLALANLPFLSVHAHIGLGMGAFLVKPVATRAERAELHMLLTQELFKRVDVSACSTILRTAMSIS
jgi:hypothetical protein